MKFAETYLALQTQDAAESLQTFLSSVQKRSIFEKYAKILFGAFFRPVVKENLVKWFTQQPWFFDSVLPRMSLIEQYCEFDFVQTFLTQWVQSNKMDHYNDWSILFGRSFSVEQTKQLFHILSHLSSPLFIQKSEYERMLENATEEKRIWLWSNTNFNSFENDCFTFHWNSLEKIENQNRFKLKYYFQFKLFTVFESLEPILQNFETQDPECCLYLLQQITSSAQFQIVLAILPSFCQKYCFQLFANALEHHMEDVVFFLWDHFHPVLKTKIFLTHNGKRFQLFRNDSSHIQCLEKTFLTYFFEFVRPYFPTYSSYFAYIHDSNWNFKCEWAPSLIVSPNETLEMQPRFTIQEFPSASRFIENVNFTPDCAFLINACGFSSSNSLSYIRWAVQNHFVLSEEDLAELFENTCDHNPDIAFWALSIFIKTNTHFEKILQKGMYYAACSKTGFHVVQEILKHCDVRKEPQKFFTECSFYNKKTPNELKLYLDLFDHTFLFQNPQDAVRAALMACNREIVLFYMEYFKYEISQDDCEWFVQTPKPCIWIFSMYKHHFDNLWNRPAANGKTIGERYLTSLVTSLDKDNQFDIIAWLVVHMPSIHTSLLKLDHSSVFLTLLKVDIAKLKKSDSECCSICYCTEDLVFNMCQHSYCTDCVVEVDKCVVCSKSLFG